MAATELLASGNTEADATEITLTPGTPVTLTIHFTGKARGIAYKIFHKNAAGSAYQHVFTLTPRNQAEMGTLSGSGVYKPVRQQCANASSLERD